MRRTDFHQIEAHKIEGDSLHTRAGKEAVMASLRSGTAWLCPGVGLMKSKATKKREQG